MLLKIYEVCFLVGCIYAAISFVFGGLFDFFDFDFDIDLDDFIPIPFLPVKPFIILTFVAVFGGLGIIFLRMDLFQYTPVLTTLPASFFAFILSRSLYLYLYLPLKRVEKTVKKQSAALGQKAVIRERILPNSFGRITYIIDGNILSAAAKEKHPGNGFNKGEEVLIEEIKDNIFYVSSFPSEKQQSQSQSK